MRQIPPNGEPNWPPYLWWRTRRIVEFQSFPGYSSTGADGNGREQTRHGYPFGRHHIAPTIIDTAREKRHGLLERSNRKFGITFSFMCNAKLSRNTVCVTRNCRATLYVYR
jgi:hypothetical protein